MLLLNTNDLHAYGQSVVHSGAELLAALPCPPYLAVTAEDVMTGPSWDMPPSTMLALAHRVREAILDEGYDGVVVAHGPDTLEESAYLTDLLAGEAAAQAAIVFTGEIETLRDALTAAADPALRGAGAVVCFGTEVHAARWASSAPFTPLAKILGDRVVTVTAPPPRPPHPVGRPASDVALIRAYPGMTDTLLTAAVDAGAAGVVLEGTGAGNVPTELFATITELTEWGVPVVVAARHPYRQLPEADLPSATGLALTVGAISARHLSAGKARVALMVALGTGSLERTRHWFGQL